MTSAALHVRRWSENDHIACRAYWSEFDQRNSLKYHPVWSDFDHIARRAYWSEIDQQETRLNTRFLLSNESLVLRLMYALDDRDGALLLWYLLAQQADTSPLRTSRRAIHADMGGLVGLTNLLGATSRLARAGLIETRVYPRTFTEYRVRLPELRTLLNHPLPQINFVPGIEPDVPFVRRWNEGQEALEVPVEVLADDQSTEADQSDNLSSTEKDDDS